jgi:hypothetical protein
MAFSSVRFTKSLLQTFDRPHQMEDLPAAGLDHVFSILHGVEKFRFKFLIRCIRFDDRTTRDERKRQDHLLPIRQIFTAFVDNCKKWRKCDYE